MTSPAPGSTITSLGADGLVVAGRVARPDVVQRVLVGIGDRAMIAPGLPVAEDGTFRTVLDAGTLTLTAPAGATVDGVFPRRPV